MNRVQDLSYFENILLSDGFEYQGYPQWMTLSKCHCDTDSRDRYYLKTGIMLEDQLYQFGYLYFYLDFYKRMSNFIGVYVKDEYRNAGIASLLISNWIQLCLEKEISQLKTITKQRKPFVLYLLKQYAFEIKNLENYQTSSRVVHICQKEEDNNKYLMFVNKKEEEIFSRGNIINTDNYKIISDSDDNVDILDSVILGSPYYLMDNEKAYQRSLQICNRHKR